MRKNKVEIISFVIFTILIIVYIKTDLFSKNEISYELQNNFVENDNTNTKENKEEKKMIKVHIDGAVKNGGVFELPENSILEDAIKMAGGFTEDADTGNVNLAYYLNDGEKIYIYTNAEMEEFENKGILQDFSNPKNKVNINTSKVEELESIDGIGRALANRIIEYREQNGKFKSIDDLKNVSGIGDKKFEAIKEKISV